MLLTKQLAHRTETMNDVLYSTRDNVWVMIIQHSVIFRVVSRESLTNRCWRRCCGLFCLITPNKRRFNYVFTTAAAVILRIDELILLNTFIYVCWHVHAHQQPFKYMGIIFHSEYIYAPPSVRPIPKPTKESGQRKREKVMRTSLRPHARSPSPVRATLKFALFAKFAFVPQVEKRDDTMSGILCNTIIICIGGCVC